MSWNNINWSYRRQNIIGPAQLKASYDVFHPTADQHYALGTEYWTNDGMGRAFRYCKAGSVALTKSLIGSSPTQDAQAITSTAQTAYGAAAGSKKFDVLLTTGNAWSNSDLIDGLLLVSDGGTAMGDMYTIKDNKWTTSDTVMNVEIADTGGLRNAIAATDDVILFAHKCYKTVVAPTNATCTLVGVPLVDVTASYYYWAQFRGPTPVFTDNADTLVAGDCVMVSTAVAGSLALVDASADDVVVGICIHAQATSECSLVDLMIP